MPAYDLHRHLWPAQLVARLAERTAPPYLRDETLVLEPEGEFQVDAAAYGLEACLRGLDRAGLDVAVVSCPPTLGIELLRDDEAKPLLDAYHEGALEAVRAGEGRVLALSMGAPLDGFVGTSIAASELVRLDRHAAVFQDLERSGRFLFVHPGPGRPPAGAPIWWAPVVDYTAQMQQAYAGWLAHGVERWPKLRVLFAILAGGAPFQLERLASRGGQAGAALHPTLYLDAASYGRRALDMCFAVLGASRIVFGSDEPVLDSRVTLEALRTFGQAALDAVSRESPAALLG